MREPKRPHVASLKKAWQAGGRRRTCIPIVGVSPNLWINFLKSVKWFTLGDPAEGATLPKRRWIGRTSEKWRRSKATALWSAWAAPRGKRRWETRRVVQTRSSNCPKGEAHNAVSAKNFRRISTPEPEISPFRSLFRPDATDFNRDLISPTALVTVTRLGLPGKFAARCNAPAKAARLIARRCRDRGAIETGHGDA